MLNDKKGISLIVLVLIAVAVIVIGTVVAVSFVGKTGNELSNNYSKLSSEEKICRTIGLCI